MFIAMMEMKTNCKLEHRRSTRREGIIALVGFGLTLGCMIAFWRLFFSNRATEYPVFFYLFWGVVGVVSIGMIYYAAINLIDHKTFICRLDGEIFECICPVSGCGENFRIRIADIVKLDGPAYYEDSRTWYIWDKQGNRYELTPNYKNPVEKFILLLKEANPSIDQVAK